MEWSSRHGTDRSENLLAIAITGLNSAEICYSLSASSNRDLMINEFHPAQEESRVKRNEAVPAGKSPSARRRPAKVIPVVTTSAAGEEPPVLINRTGLAESPASGEQETPPQQEPVDAEAETSTVTDSTTPTSTISSEAPTPMPDPYIKPQTTPATDSANQPVSGNDPAQTSANTPVQPPPRLTAWQEAEAKMALIKENRECLEWILKQQSELRLEFLNFLKKDLKEIQTVMSDVRHGAVTDEMAAETLVLIKSTYTEYWKRSFDLISPADLLGPSTRKEIPEESSR